MKQFAGALRGSLFIFCFLFITSCNKSPSAKAATKAPQLVHLAHLSENWYPKETEILSQELDGYFNLARKHFPIAVDAQTVRALIVPHAGMYFSGLCAATAYQTLLYATTNIKRVIILCPAHTTFLKGCAVPRFDVYQTPLGDIEIDKKAISYLTVNQVFRGDVRAHEQEHAIEIQLPFLQKTIAEFKLVPLIVGHTTDKDIEDIIHGLKKIINKETLVIISSDFLHHGAQYDYAVFDQNIMANIRFFDAQAVNTICAQDFRGFEQFLKKTGATICGQNPIKILLGLINERIIDGVNAKLSCYYTSAHMNKARNKNHDISISDLLCDPSDQEARDSVSYVGMVFTTQCYKELKKEILLTGYEKKALLALARRTIARAFVEKKSQLPEHLLYPIMSFGMQQPVGTFVTLNTKSGDLRGCIGRLTATEPLFQTVMHMAIAAAFEDTRFTSLTQKELDNIIIDISILTPPVKISGYQDIKIGKHGIILHKAGNSAVFLPHVPTEYGWSLEQTLEQLSLKAGLNSDAWKSGCQFEVFEGYEIKE